MGAQTFSARAVATEASKVAKRTVTDKQVRDMARTIIARFDKTAHPQYLGHAYDAAERKLLVAAFASRAAGRTVSKPSAKRQPRAKRPTAPVAPDA